MPLDIRQFLPEHDIAWHSFERHIVCLELTPPDYHKLIEQLLLKAIDQYEKLPPDRRHAVALDNSITVILTKTADPDKPLCGIYFNLHSPYSIQTRNRKKREPKE